MGEPRASAASARRVSLVAAALVALAALAGPAPHARAQGPPMSDPAPSRATLPFAPDSSRVPPAPADTIPYAPPDSARVPPPPDTIGIPPDRGRTAPVPGAAIESPPRPHGLVARARAAAGNMLSDGWDVIRSPSRLGPTGLLWLGAFLGTGAVLLANDQEVLDALRRNREEPGLREALDVGGRIEPVGFMGRTNPIYLGLAGLGYALDVRPLRVIPLQVLESHLLAGGVRNVGKFLVGRHHPYEEDGPYAFTFGHGTSFPSGHTSVAFELATILTMNARSAPVGILAYGLATTVALQRIDSLNHWPSDVLVAAGYGTLVARTVVRGHERRELRRAWSSGLTVLPTLSGRGPIGLRVLRRF